jgi:hypothetical protein
MRSGITFVVNSVYLISERLGSCGMGLFYLLFESGASQSENYRPRA